MLCGPPWLSERWYSSPHSAISSTSSSGGRLCRQKEAPRCNRRSPNDVLTARSSTAPTAGGLAWLSSYRLTPRVVSAWPSSEARSEEHTSELQSRGHLVCRLLLEKK